MSVQATHVCEKDYTDQGDKTKMYCMEKEVEYRILSKCYVDSNEENN